MSSSAEAVADVLGIRGGEDMSWLDVLGEVERGLPLEALDRLVRQVAPADDGFIHRLVPRSTLARRRRAPRLSAAESAPVTRLADIWVLAREVWGSEAAARAFLFRAHPMLGGQLPIEVVLRSEFGKPLVENILGGLRYGAAA